MKRNNNNYENIICPYCGNEFNFESISKNEWGVDSNYLLLRCPICSEFLKIEMND